MLLPWEVSYSPLALAATPLPMAAARRHSALSTGLAFDAAATADPEARRRTPCGNCSYPAEASTTAAAGRGAAIAGKVSMFIIDWAQLVLRRLDAERFEHVSLHLAQPNHVALQLEHIALQLERVADSLPHDAVV